MRKFLRHCWLLLFGALLTLNAQKAQASHAIGSDMNYVNVGPNLYLVTYRFYRDCSGIPEIRTQDLNYVGQGCAPNNGNNAGGTLQLIRRNIEDGNPYCGRVLSTQAPCDTTDGVSTRFPNYQVWTYSGIVTLPAQCTTWRMSVSIGVRPAIANIDGTPNLFSEVRLNNRDVADDSSPAFSVAPGFKPLIFVCDSSTNTIGNAVTDPDGDSLVYSLAPALDAANTPVTYAQGYTFLSPIRRLTSPNDSVFGQPIIPFQIDPQNGTISFTAGVDARFNATNENRDNKFVVVIQIDAYRKVNGQVVRTGSVRRDILVVIFPCTSQPTAPSVPGGDSVVVNPGIDTTYYNSRYDTLRVDACTSSRIEFPILDINGDSIYAQIDTSQLPGGASLQIVRQQTAGTIRIATARLIWVPNDSTVGGNYPITINIRDNGCPVPTQNSLRLILKVIRNSYADVGLFTSNNNGQNDTLCVGQITRLVATTQRPATIGYPPRPATYRYNWLMDSDSSIIRVNKDTAVVRPRRTTRYKLEVVSPQGCVDTASILVIVDTANVAKAAVQTDSICVGGNTQLQATSRTRATGPDGRPIVYTYRWRTNPLLSDTTVANPVASGVRQNTRFFLTVFSSLGCTDTASVAVHVDPTNVASATVQTDSICLGGTTQLQATSRPDTLAPNGNRITYTYRWRADSTLSDTTVANPVITGLKANRRFFVTVYSDFGCTDTASVLVRVNPTNVARAEVVPGQPDGICPGAQTQLTVLTRDPLAANIYRWSPAAGLSDTTSANPYAAPTTTTRYRVRVFNPTGCTDTASVVVRNLGPLPSTPVASPGADSTSFPTQTLEYGKPLQLDVRASNDNGQFTYVFTPTDGLSNPNSATPDVTDLQATTEYQITIANENGCSVQRKITVIVPLSIPNIITPGSLDGKNDKFIILGSDLVELSIFNRWGTKIKEWKDYDNSWDGGDLPAGTYYYLVKDREKDKEYKGWLQIVR